MRTSDLGLLKRWFLALHLHVARTRPQHYELRLAPSDARWIAGWYVRWLARSNSFVLVAEVGGNRVGFLAAGIADSPDRYTRLEESPNLQGHIHDVFVEPRARHRGVATALFEAVEERFRAAGCDNLRLGVAAGNEGARKLYRRLGFEEHKLGLRKDIAKKSPDWNAVRRRRRRAIQRDSASRAILRLCGKNRPRT